jgi:hypothetical protein
MAYGQDPAIVLIRKGDPVDTKLVPFTSHTLDYFEGKWEHQGEHTHIHVVFCDKVYHGVFVDNHYFWSADAVRKHMATLRDSRMVVTKYWNEKKRRPLEAYFVVDDISESLRETMIRNRWAILKVEEKDGYHKIREVVMNPSNLKQYEFAKALDPYTAYQNLGMWVGGVLCGQSPEIVTITDNRTILEGHGFDNVISFRGPRV